MKLSGKVLAVLSLSTLAGLMPWQAEEGLLRTVPNVLTAFAQEDIEPIEDKDPEPETAGEGKSEPSTESEKGEPSTEPETNEPSVEPGQSGPSAEPGQTDPSIEPETEKKAEDKNVPGNVKTLKAKILSETSIKLTWTKVSRASGYQVVMTNLKTGKKLKTTTGKRSITVKKLIPGVKYTFQVKAVRKGVLSKKFSPKATVKTAVNKPDKVKNVRMSRYLNNTLNFKWDKIKGASCYEIFYKSRSASEYKLAGSTKKLYYSLKNLKPDTLYDIRVRAVRTVLGVSRPGKMSAVMTAMAEKIILPNIHGRRFNVTMKQTARATEYGTNKPITIPAGTRMLAWQGGGSVITCDLTSDPDQKTDYKVVRVPIKYLRYSWLATTSDWYVYTKQQKELWINQHFYSSSTDYLIWVNQYTCNTSVFQGKAGKWRMVHSSVCVVGKYGGTGVGTEKLLFRVPYLYGDVGVYFTWNATKGIGNAFHQRVDANTRAAASSGCVRLGKSDLYYIYNNIPLGTTVVLT